jgi:hypothetical protein
MAEYDTKCNLPCIVRKVKANVITKSLNIELGYVNKRCIQNSGCENSENEEVTWKIREGGKGLMLK